MVKSGHYFKTLKKRKKSNKTRVKAQPNPLVKLTLSQPRHQKKKKKKKVSARAAHPYLSLKTHGETTIICYFGLGRTVNKAH